MLGAGVRPVVPRKREGPMCLIKHTEGQRATLASKMSLNIHHVPKACIGVNLGFNDHHPGSNIFFTHPSATPLIRGNYEVVSLIPFGWKPKPVHQQTYTTNILRRNDFLQPDQAIDQTSTSSTDTPAESADTLASESAQTTFQNFQLLTFRLRSFRPASRQCQDVCHLQCPCPH